jgi:hypothetical protein
MAQNTSDPNIKSQISSEDTRPQDKTDSAEKVPVIDSSNTTCNEDGTISSVRVVILGVMLLTIGAIGFYNLPGMISTDAKGSRLVNSIYCSTITLTTYVYGSSCCSPNAEQILRYCK